MRIAGVRLPDGRAVWVDAGKVEVSVRDTALVRLADGDARGFVFVSPEQLAQPPEHVAGYLVEAACPASSETSCADLPGADMPALGSIVEIEGEIGTVTGIDAVKREATITREDGSSETRQFVKR
jgi:hypothetical protein